LPLERCPSFHSARNLLTSDNENSSKNRNPCRVAKRKDYLSDEDAAAAWVAIGLADTHISDDAVKVIVQKRFGTKAVIYDRKDKGSNKECTSKDYTVVPIGSMSKEEWRNVKHAGAMKTAGEVCPTDIPNQAPQKTLARDELTPILSRFERLIQDLAR